jgi:AraC-like DNA-binding protein
MKVSIHSFPGSEGGGEGLAGSLPDSAPEDRFEAFFVLAGALQVCFMEGTSGEHYRICAGRCSMRFLAGACHRMECRSEDGAEVLRIAFTSPDLLGWGSLRLEMDEAAGLRCPARVDVPMDPRMERVVDRIREALEHDPSGAPLALSCALELLWHVSRARERASLSVAERERSAVDTARRILEGSLDDPPSLEELAYRVGMSVSKFKEVFTRNCGKPPYAFLREVRLDRAMCLLRNGGVRVTEAALEVGYNNLSYFAKAFTERFGVRPSQVREGS